MPAKSRSKPPPTPLAAARRDRGASSAITSARAAANPNQEVRRNESVTVTASIPELAIHIVTPASYCLVAQQSTGAKLASSYSNRAGNAGDSYWNGAIRRSTVAELADAVARALVASVRSRPIVAAAGGIHA